MYLLELLEEKLIVNFFLRNSQTHSGNNNNNDIITLLALRVGVFTVKEIIFGKLCALFNFLLLSLFVTLPLTFSMPEF